jgi:hypothetical protein
MQQDLNFTSPTLVPGDGVLFSAYGVSRGFHYAFLLSYDAACQKLGGANSDPQELLLAFKLNRLRIARDIEAKDLPTDGSAVVLSSRDFV